MGIEGRISIMEAVSWIAYGDFDASKKECIPCDSPPTEDAISNSIDAFRAEISDAEKHLLLKIRGGNLLVYGVPYGSNGESLLLIPLDTLEAAGIKLLSSSNKILRYTKDDRPIQSSMWVDVEVRKDDVVRLWPKTASRSEKADDHIQAYGLQLSHLQGKTDGDNSSLLLPPDKSSDDRQVAAFALLDAESGNKKIGRKDARDWFGKKGCPKNWGDAYVKQLQAHRKRKRGERAKNKVAI